MIGAAAALVLFAHHFAMPWYAKERSPFGRPELVERFVEDPETAVVCFPRNCDSLAFYTDRSDLRNVRTKDVNQLFVDCHHRPRTVILFTHRESFAGFKRTLPPSLAIVESATLRRGYGNATPRPALRLDAVGPVRRGGGGAEVSGAAGGVIEVGTFGAERSRSGRLGEQACDSRLESPTIQPRPPACPR